MPSSDAQEESAGSARASGPVSSFDAGSMGCGDGLPMAFRRHIQSVEVGEAIEVIVRDPSAREDLPSLARLMGHRIRSTDQRDDGGLTIVVERAR